MTPRAKKTNKSSKPETKPMEEMDSAQGQENVEEPEKLKDPSSSRLGYGSRGSNIRI